MATLCPARARVPRQGRNGNKHKASQEEVLETDLEVFVDQSLGEGCCETLVLGCDDNQLSEPLIARKHTLAFPREDLRGKQGLAHRMVRTTERPFPLTPLAIRKASSQGSHCCFKLFALPPRAVPSTPVTPHSA